MHRSAFLALVFLSVTPAARAQFELPGAEPASVATLVPEVKSIAPGSTFSVALSLEHPEKWHSYYQNSGGVELPPSVTWKVPLPPRSRISRSVPAGERSSEVA